MNISHAEKKQKWAVLGCDESKIGTYTYAEKETFFHRAIALDYVEKMNLFLPDIVQNTGMKDVFLNIAASGAVTCLKSLIDQGFNFKPFQDLMLIDACHTGALPMVKMLLKHGADIHTEDDTPLRTAFIQQQTDVVKHLIQTETFPQNQIFKLCLYGLRVGDIYHVDLIFDQRIKTQDSKNRLMRFICCDPQPHVGQIEYLADQGADVGHERETPLRLAMINQNLRNIGALLRRGADPYFLPDGEWNGIPKLLFPIQEIFKKSGDEIAETLEKRVLNNVDDWENFLMTKDPITGMTGLMMAARAGCMEEVVKTMIAKNPDKAFEMFSAERLLKKEKDMPLLDMLYRTHQLTIVFKNDRLWPDDRLKELMDIVQKLPAPAQKGLLKGYLKTRFQNYTTQENQKRLRGRAQKRKNSDKFSL